MRHRPFLLAAALLLTSASAARAYINSAPCIEWQATFRPLIVEAKVTAINGRKEQAFNTLTLVTATLSCDVTHAYKGKIDSPITFQFSAYQQDADLGAIGATYLLFLDTDDTTGKTTVHEYINLDHPGTSAAGVAYDKTGKILSTKNEILSALTDRLKLLEKSPIPDLSTFAPTAPRTLSIEAPGQSAQSLDAGSSCFLLVPPDKEFQPAFLARAQDAMKTASARFKSAEDPKLLWLFDDFFPLAYCTDEKSTALLRSTLQDLTAIHVRLFADRDSNMPAQELTVYPLRQCAYEILKARGTKLDPPQGYSPLLHPHFQGPGGGANLNFRPAGATHDLNIEFEKLESPTPPGK